MTDEKIKVLTFMLQISLVKKKKQLFRDFQEWKLKSPKVENN